MKIAVISFTRNGKCLADHITELLKVDHEVINAVKCSSVSSSIGESLSEWTGKMFQSRDALVFVGAVQIAVRAIAPYVRSKKTDPAVLVFDEKGTYGIPVLSGHLGGANELAMSICAGIQARPVVTTATDLQGRWAVDVFARKNGLVIREMERARQISAAVLEGRKITIAADDWTRRVEGVLPEDVVRYEDTPGAEPDIRIGILEQERQTLHLIPRAVIAGIGCKKGVSAAQIEEAVDLACSRAGVCRESIYKVASIDLKAREQGLLEYCDKYRLERSFYSAEELGRVPGIYSGSEFVACVTGVDNVCERSAVLASGGGRLIAEKLARNGVTVALAQKDWRVRFE